MSDYIPQSKQYKHIFIDEDYSDENDELEPKNKGYVYVIDFNPVDCKIIGIPSYDEDGKLKHNVKIGRTIEWITGRKQHYSDMNIFSQKVRLLFCCETDDCVAMESYLHNEFVNDTTNDPVKRELFQVDETIDTLKKLKNKFNDLIKKSKINAKDVTDEQKKEYEFDILKSDTYDEYIIRKGRNNMENQHIQKRIDFFESIRMTVKDFKNKKYSKKLSTFGKSPNRASQYANEDFKYDIKKGYLKLEEPKTETKLVEKSN